MAHPADRTPHVMHLIATNFFGGPEKQCVEHLRRLNAARFRGSLASFIEGGRPNEALERARASGLAAHGLPMSGPLDLGAWVRLGRILRREKVDLLCTHGYRSTIMGSWAAKRARVPVLAFSRGYTAEDLKVASYEWLERRLLKGLGGVVCVSEGQMRKLDPRGLPPGRSWVVHNAIEAGADPPDCAETRREVRLRFGLPGDAVLVVSAGRLSPEKGQRFLLEAIRRLGARAGAARFLFCGDGPWRERLPALAWSLGIGERCRFPGFRRDLEEIFRAMDLLVLPSLTEGLPNVVLEAFACAKPVVASAVGGVPELVEDGGNGLLTPPADPEVLKEAIAQCLASPESMRAMGRRGLETVRARFSFDEQNRKLERIYGQLLNGNSCRRSRSST